MSAAASRTARRRAVPLTLLLAATALALSPGAAGGQTAPALSVAVIDVARLLQDSKIGRQTVERLKTLREQQVAKLKSQQDATDALGATIEEGRLSLAEERLAQLQKEYEDGLIALRRMRDDAQREFQKAEKTAFDEIQDRVMPIIDQVGREFGYTLIFNKFDSGLVFARDEVDITALILERFDAAVAAAPAAEGG